MTHRYRDSTWAVRKFRISPCTCLQHGHRDKEAASPLQLTGVPLFQETPGTGSQNDENEAVRLDLGHCCMKFYTRRTCVVNDLFYC